MEVRHTHILEAAPSLLEAINNFADALRGLSTPAQTHPQQQQPEQQKPPLPYVAPQSTTPAPSIPQQPPVMQAPTTPAAAVPMAPAPTAAAPATAAPAPAPIAPAAMPTIYTPEQINEACRPLIDAGRLTELKNVINGQFGVASLHQMTPEQLAQFVVVVRGMGAAI